MNLKKKLIIALISLLIVSLIVTIIVISLPSEESETGEKEETTVEEMNEDIFKVDTLHVVQLLSNTRVISKTALEISDYVPIDLVEERRTFWSHDV